MRKSLRKLFIIWSKDWICLPFNWKSKVSFYCEVCRAKQDRTEKFVLFSSLHKGLWQSEAWTDHSYYGKDLRIIKNLCWKQTPTVTMDNEIRNFQQIKRCTTRLCIIPLSILSVQRDDYESLRSIQIGGHHINNLRYADDTVIIARTEEKTYKS